MSQACASFSRLSRSPRCKSADPASLQDNAMKFQRAAEDTMMLGDGFARIAKCLKFTDFDLREALLKFENKVGAPISRGGAKTFELCL